MNASLLVDGYPGGRPWMETGPGSFLRRQATSRKPSPARKAMRCPSSRTLQCLLPFRAMASSRWRSVHGSRSPSAPSRFRSGHLVRGHFRTPSGSGDLPADPPSLQRGPRARWRSPPGLPPPGAPPEVRCSRLETAELHPTLLAKARNLLPQGPGAGTPGDHGMGHHGRTGAASRDHSPVPEPFHEGFIGEGGLPIRKEDISGCGTAPHR